MVTHTCEPGPEAETSLGSVVSSGPADLQSETPSQKEEKVRDLCLFLCPSALKFLASFLVSSKMSNAATTI